ncbi:M23 family metallopeptidase [Cohnella laeviribosi]|uniref:M23 family metallopeptidase n=1 Tax=Cohnella laeviribosi TaxID=380174 RepID=UPI003D2453E5
MQRQNVHPTYGRRMLSKLAAAAAAGMLGICVFIPAGTVLAGPDAEAKSSADREPALRQLYERVGLMTNLPWYSIAAIDQYERTMSKAHPKSRPLPEGALSGIFIPPEQWAGHLNPDPNDTNPLSIRIFGGVGKDGSGDGIADRNDACDLLFAVASRIREQGGISGDDFAIGLWEYYHNTRAVQRILQFAKLYETFGKLDLSQHVFPLPIGSVYSYRSTWGNSRGWGGARIHEGTDIFANHGVPVRSTGYGVIEVKGWNPYGGWRIGIRDLDNLYHYYAHLSGFNKKLKIGDVVKPGQVIGWVGSSGYGRPGTSGKFPPHLHYGVYRDRGLVEWAFDPFPLLRSWERSEMKALKAHRRS